MVCTRLCIIFFHFALLTLIAASTLDIGLMLGLVLELADLMLVVAGLVSLVLVALQLVIFVLVAADLVPMGCVRGSIASGGCVAVALVSIILASREYIRPARKIDILISGFSQRGHTTGSCALLSIASCHLSRCGLSWRMTAALRWTDLAVVRGIHVVGYVGV
jgi:hypothetical protein